MRRLELDFQRRAAANWWGWVVLAIAAACVAAALQAQHVLQQEHRFQATRLAHLQPTGMAAATANGRGAVDDPAVIAAREVLERARLPWGDLFAALEAANGGDVALLALAPEVARHQVKIHAEARDLGAMLLFHRRLQQQAALAKVVLVDHNIVQDVAEKPVRFHLIATWGTARGAQ